MSRDLDPPLYAIRQVGNHWTVYDWRTLDPVVVRGVPQVGLDREVARSIAEFMTTAERGLGGADGRSGRLAA